MIFLLLACYGTGTTKEPNQDDSASISSTTDAGVRIQSLTDTSGKDGTVQIPVHIEVDDSVMQVDVVRSGGGDISTEYLFDAKGKKLFDWEEWADSKYSLTDAFYADGDTTVLGWPAIPSQGLLKAGDYVVSVATTDKKGNYESGVAVEATIFQRHEPDWGKGKLKVVVAYATGVADEPEVVDAVNLALERWKEIYANYGIELSWRIDNIDVDPALPDSDPGQDGYKTFTSQLTEREVVMVIGKRIAKDIYLYGEAGGIPGPLVGSNRSVVAVGWQANAGADGVFSEADIELMAETMAHETGHYLGAYHPVESNYKFWDSLDDTPECKTEQDCDGAMADNLMYPYPVCNRNGSCTTQDQSTAEQITVFNTYLAVE